MSFLPLPWRVVIGVLLMGALQLAVPAGEDHRIPAGFVYPEPTITPEKARELAKKHAVLTLLNVAELSAEVANGLVIPYQDTFLTLPAVTELDEDAAKMLATRPGYLRLWGLRTLTPGVAAALVAHKGQRLELNGVEEISPEVAAALAKGQRGGLCVGLKELPPAIAAILATTNSSLTFPKLRTLPVESADAFAAHRRSLSLGAATISEEVATALLKHQGNIGIELATRLEPGVGEILARHRYEVTLMLEEIDSVPLARKLFSEPNASSSVYRLKTISPEVAAVYAELNPGYLANVDKLSPKAAEALASGRYEVKLPALTRLSPDLAKSLTARNRSVYLRGLKALEGPDAVAVAEALASTPAPVYIPNLERISTAALASLRKKATIAIPSDDKLIIVE